MTWNALSASEILKSYDGCRPVIAKIRGTTPLDKTYRFYFGENEERHLVLSRKRKDGEVTAYVNLYSLTGEPFIDDSLPGVTVSERYARGHVGRTGGLGIGSSVGRLRSLNPKTNEVLRLHVNGPSSFKALVDWYSGRRNSATPVDSEIAAARDGVFPAYMRDPVKRTVIEKAAVGRAIAHYTAAGFSVAERGKPYDLHCVKGELVVHVEVKGTTGDGTRVFLTKNEVLDARDPAWRSDLFIVKGIRLTSSGNKWVAEGGVIDLIESWTPHDDHLEALQFAYKVPVGKTHR